MSTIDQIANNESGLSVREKLNSVHDQIVEISANYAQLQPDDVLIGTAAVAFNVDLLSVTAVPPATPFKSLTVFNLEASVAPITLVPFGAETIDGLASVDIAPGTVVTITPTSTEWVTHNLGIVDTVGAGTGINITGTAEDPVVNVNTSLSSQTINNVLLDATGSIDEFLNQQGDYVQAVTSVTGGTNISSSGGSSPQLDLDAAITGVSVDGVSLTTGDPITSFLNGAGNYVPPTDNFVNVSATYAQLPQDDVIIGSQVTPFAIELLPLVSVVKVLTIRNDGPADIAVAPDGVETIDGNASRTITAGGTITIVPESATNWIELAPESGVQGVTAGTFASVDNTDPANPIVSADNIYTINGTITGTRFLEGKLGNGLFYDFFDQNDPSDSVDISSFGISPPSISFSCLELDGAGGFVGSRTLNIGSTAQGGMSIDDQSDGEGLKYKTDLSATFVPRSMVDKAYVDATAQLAAATVQVFDEADIIAAFGAGPVWVLADVNLQVMANITLTVGNSFLIDSTSVTILGVDRNTSSLTADSSQALLNFTSGSATDLQLRIKNINLAQNGIGEILREDGTRFIVEFDNCGLTGNTTGGNITLFNGQFIGFVDGVLQGGASILQGDGTAGSPGVEFIFFTKNFLGITDLFADGQRWMEFLPFSKTRRLSTAGFSIQINPDFGFTDPRTDGIGFYFHKNSVVDILTGMNGGLNPLAATSTQFVMEDPASVGLGLLGGNTFTGAGQVFGFRETPPDSTVNQFSLRGCGVDADNNLITVEQGPSNIRLHVGLTSSVTSTMTLGGTPTNVTWYKGNLVHLDAADEEMMIEDGFPNGPSAPTATVDLALLTPSLAGGRGVATDGSRFFIAGPVNGSVHVFGPDFFTATTPVQLFSFIVPGTLDIEGMDYDGVNLWVVSTTTNEVICLKGVSPEIQYSFSTADGDPVSIAFTQTGYMISDSGSDNVSIHSVFPTFDHSSPTWELVGNTGDHEDVQVDPVVVASWTTGNSGTIDDLSETVIELTNGAAASGFADFAMPCVVGRTYVVTNGYTPGTSASATFSILDEALATVVSETVSVAGNVVLTFVAPDQAMTFRFQNTSIIITEDSTLTSLSQLDKSYKIVESSDRGGSVFKDSNAPAIVPQLTNFVAGDISDGGIDIRYAPITAREKSRLINENTGAVEITSVRDRGQTFFGSFLGKSLGASTGEYELLVSINGEVQEDSLGSNIWSGNNEIQLITTQPITRDVTDTDDVRLQLRPADAAITVDMGVMRCSLSHTE